MSKLQISKAVFRKCGDRQKCVFVIKYLFKMSTSRKLYNRLVTRQINIYFLLAVFQLFDKYITLESTLVLLNGFLVI